MCAESFDPSADASASTPDDRQERFARAIALIDGALDWELLAELHGASPEEDFFAESQRDAMVETGLQFASDLASRLPAGGRSLYIGAAVAEFVPMLLEQLVLEREVHWLTLEGEETREYRRVLQEVAGELSLELFAPSTAGLAELPKEQTFDHLWLVSVWTDPSCFPGLHDQLYERSGTAESADPAGLADVEQERKRAIDSSREALARLESASGTSLVTSTDEEWPLLLEAGREIALAFELESRARLSGLVGDAVRFGTLHRA
ncbi:MAG: hypothetical protein AAF368_13230 [Planctomycetota bacterium]